MQKQKVKMAMAWHGEQNKHYLWDKIQLRHIFHTAKLAGLSKQAVEEILQEIVTASSQLHSIPTQHLPEQIVEPILSGVVRKLVVVNG